MDRSRLHLLELIAYWEGRVSTSQLREAFGIGRTQASKDIAEYRQHNPNNLYYSASAKGYLPNRQFDFAYISGDVNEYLDWRHGLTRNSPREANSLNIEPVARQVSAVVMRALIKAIRQQRVVEVDYVSLTHPEHDGRLISPHSFVKTSQRWHLRAYCEKNRAYRDFVLSRFRGTPEIEGLSQHTAAQDQAWNTEVELIICPDPRLSAAQRQVLAQDYAMQNGQLKIRTRAALATYLLKDLQINTKNLADDPLDQQLVLTNQADLAPWLF